MDLIMEMLTNYQTYGVSCFVPLSMVVKEVSTLEDDDVKYLMYPGTHLDFLIYNKLDKHPILAVETDGYGFHKDGTIQAKRDKRKDRILSC